MNQNDYILEHLKSGRSINPAEADALFACKRLGARIYDLKKMGYRIVSECETGENRFGNKCHWSRYRMV